MSGAIPFVSDRGSRVLAEAILYRVFKSIPRIISNSSFTTCSLLLNELIPDFTMPGNPMPVWEWILTMPSRRRKALVRALRKLEERGEFNRNFEIIKAFVKTEHLPYFKIVNGTISSDDVEYVARLIQAPHDETHLVAGPYMKPLVSRLKGIWHAGNWIFYASVSPEKLDTWLARVQHASSYYWSDYSAFDATWSPQAWAMIESMYHTIYPGAPDEFWRVLQVWRKPRGKIHCRRDATRLTYDGPVCMTSGRDDTALANAILNGCVIACSFAAALANKSVAELLPSDLRRASELINIAVVGDDSLVACSFDVEPFKAAIQVNIESFGLIVKAESSTRLCDVTFLGMMPYPAAGKLHWGPTIGRRMYKAFWQADPVGNLPAWTKGVAEQLSQFRCVPLLSDCADRVLDLLARSKVTKAAVDENRVWSARTSDTARWDDSTLEWISMRYEEHGMSPALIRHDLEVIRGIQRLPAVIRLRSVEICLLMDEL